MAETLYRISVVQTRLKEHDLPSSYPTVLKLIETGQLKASKVGGQWRVKECDLKEYLEAGDSNTLESLIESYGGLDNIPKRLRVKYNLYGESLEKKLKYIEDKKIKKEKAKLIAEEEETEEV